MSEGAAIRALLVAQARERSALGPATLAVAIYLLMGVCIYGFVAITWDEPPGPVVFLVIFDLLFVLLAVGGLSFRADEEPAGGTLSGLRTTLIASGGAWQVIKSIVKGLLFVLPYSAFDALRSVLPPLAAADDPAACKALRRIAVLKGGVPLPLFRYLCGEPADASFKLALEAAAYLDAAHVRGRGEDSKIVPGLHLSKLAAAVGATQRRPSGATQPGTTRVPSESGRTPVPPRQG